MHSAAAGALLLGVLTLSATITSAQDQKADAKVLLEWKRTFKVTGKLAAFLDTGDRAWRQEGLPCDSSWYGIRCEVQQGVPRVAVINFNLYRLRPSFFGARLIPQLGDLPLRSIFLRCPPGNCKIEGSFPQELTKIESMVTIVMRNPNMTGSLPSAAHLPPGLKRLELLGCRFEGGLPGDLAQMTRLKKVALEDCGLSGPLPGAVQMPPSIKRLSLANNEFTGTFPASWLRNLKLVELDLSQNQLRGKLPALTCPNPFLDRISLIRNRFSGPLPESWGLLTNVSFVALFDNSQLSGPVPKAWSAPGAFSQLLYMGLQSGTGLCGAVPPGGLEGRVFSIFNTVATLGRCPTTCSAPPGASCTSTFFSLPEAPGAPGSLLAYNTADAAAAKQAAAAFCQSKGFSAAGTAQSITLPSSYAAQSFAWRTLDASTGAACEGQPCAAFSIIECVPTGAQALGPDSRGNIGCGNTGANNLGSFNRGDGNVGGCNQGNNNQGDSNSGNGSLGSANSKSAFFGDGGLPWATPQREYASLELKNVMLLLGWAEGQQVMTSLRVVWSPPPGYRW